MSEPTNKIDPKAPVTLGQLETILQNISATFNDALTKRDQQNEARFNQFASVLQQVVDKVNQTGPAPSVGSPPATIDKDVIINKLFDKLADRYLGTEESDPEIKVYEGEVQLGMKRLYKNGLKTTVDAIGRLLKQEVNHPGSVSKRVATDIVSEIHGPI